MAKASQMKDLFRIIIANYQSSLREWSQKRVANLAVFNIILLLLVMLRSAGYFEPFFPLTISLIVLIALVLAVLLLGAGSGVIFAFGMLFMLFASVFKLAGVEIWAERLGIYTFESLFVGVVTLLFEKIRDEK